MTLSDQHGPNPLKLAFVALEEDLGVRGIGGDRTTRALISGEQKGSAVFVARTNGVLAGLCVAETVVHETVRCLLEYLDSPLPDEKSLHGLEDLSFQAYFSDGNTIHSGDRIAQVEGSVAGILAAERSALNFLQHLSGIATQTWRYVQQVQGFSCRILDTRKTLPGLRSLEKYAVRCGGGFNHRMSLHDAILIKDNHLAALGGGPDAMRSAIRQAREKNPDLSLEVEVESLDLLRVALECNPDIILLDNMSLDQMQEAVQMRNAKAPKIQLEASGGITLENVRSVAETGVDRISVGALTHSAPALDIALDYEMS